MTGMDTPFPTAVIDLDGQVIKHNAGWTNAELGDDLSHMIHPLDWCDVLPMLAARRAFRLNVRSWHLGQWWSVRMTAIPVDESFQIGWDALHPMPKTMDASGAVDGELLGGIVHSFNNYLSAMMGFSELALLDLPVSHGVYGQLETVLESGQSAVSFTQQLLTTASRAALKPQEQDWRDFIEEFCTLRSLHLRFEGETQSVKLDTEFVRRAIEQMHEFLKKQNSSPVYVEASVISLGQQSAALLDSVEGDYAFVSLRQLGPGFEEIHVEKLLQPYYVSKVTADKKGLGLAPAKGIFHQLGGNVLCMSEQGIGTCFIAMLPVQKKQPIPAERNKSVNYAIDSNNTALWLIHDLPSYAQHLHAQLSAFEPMVTLSKQEAITLMQQGIKPRILISAQLLDISTFRAHRQALDFSHVVCTPFPEKVPISEPHVFISKYAFSGEPLKRVLGGLM